MSGLKETPYGILWTYGMFEGASKFNQELNAWDISSVTTTSYMFAGAYRFNQSLNAWNVSWVTDMSFMFAGASDFNQPLDAWDVRSVTDTRCMLADVGMRAMFAYASSFNQDLCPWGNISTFPYGNGCVDGMFSFSGCTYQASPIRSSKGPFCASKCIMPESPSVRQFYSNETFVHATALNRASTSSSNKQTKPICYYPGNNKCPQVPQKSTASSCSCK